MKNIKIILILLLNFGFNLFGIGQMTKNELEDWYKLNKAFLPIIVDYIKKDEKTKNDQLVQAILNRDFNRVQELVAGVKLATDDGKFSEIIYQSYIYIKDLDESFRQKNENSPDKVVKIAYISSPLSLSIINYSLASNGNDKENSFKIIEILLKNKANPNAKLGRAYFDDKGRDYLLYYLLSEELFGYNCPVEVFKLLLQYGLKINYKLKKDFACGCQSLRDLAKQFLRDDVLLLIK